MAEEPSQRINPPDTALGSFNAVMGGLYAPRGGHRPFEQAADFTGPLSLKVMVQGQGQWRTARRRHVVDAGFCLILNRGETYSLTFEPEEPVETFCPFFAHGFAEGATRSLLTGDEALLDEPHAGDGSNALVFEPHVQPLQPDLTLPLCRLRRLAREAELCDLAWDDAFVDLSPALARLAAGWRTEHAKSCHRAVTRVEITRRLNRARDFIHAEAHRRLALAEIACVASLSPHHRLFAAAFRATPAAYVTRLRLTRAAHRLAATDAPVTEICLAVG